MQLKRSCQVLLRKFYQLIRAFNPRAIHLSFFTSRNNIIQQSAVGIEYRMQEIGNVWDALSNFVPSEDGTYELLTHRSVEYSSGYQVSFVRPEAIEQLSHEEWDILTSYCCGYTQSDAHIGVYAGSSEISFHCMDISKAEKMMYEFNQETILDWKEKETYPEDFIRWFIVNPNFDENKMVNYHEILERIQ